MLRHFSPRPLQGERVSWVKIHANCFRCDVCASRSIHTHPRGDQKASVEAKALDRRTGTGIASAVEQKPPPRLRVTSSLRTALFHLSVAKDQLGAWSGLDSRQLSACWRLHSG